MRPLLAAAWALPLLACIELDEFPNESIVTGPRVLAVVTDPPELTPGNSLAISVLVAEAEDVDVEYVVCGIFDSPFGGGGQFGERAEEECSENPLLRGAGERLVVPSELIDALRSRVDVYESVLGSQLPQETIEAIRTTVGFPLLIDVSIEADGRQLQAVKRILLSENPAPHENPPPPRFRFGDIDVRADAGAAWSCTSSEPLTARAGEKIELVPEAPDGEEDWVEPYRVINARGETEERSERAFYSWFATGGDFDRHVTRAPLRNQLWTAPTLPGSHRLWLVVRDGHGGTSACGVEVRVR